MHHERSGCPTGCACPTYFALSGERHPYKEGPLGVIKEGAYADILLVDGNPLKDVKILGDGGKNIPLIMKDGKIYKNTLQ